ncbi:MAG TPA: ATP-binding SpoIIE family protein phosphatase [Terriglobales bacterium]|nr:ATP-binding SpoIIE family protein phosphatase [Terriglobales bacterium]
MSSPQLSIQISDNTHVSEARRASVHMAKMADFDSHAAGRLAIVVSELARNVLLHGGGGEIVLQCVGSDTGSAVNVLALDRGPGIQDVGRALADGYSSAGTSGTGLGAVNRMASLEVYTQAGKGTAVLATVSAEKPKQNETTTGAVCVPIHGESRCGDDWDDKQQTDKRLIMLADGLGHGPAAADAAEEAIAAFRANLHRSPKEIIELAHARLQKTRGAAVAVAEIDFGRQIVRYSGVGNIAGTLLVNGSSRSLISGNGIVGHQLAHAHEFTFPWERTASLIMHSDGVNTRWSLDPYPGLKSKSPALIAGVLYRDFKRGRDDATVVVSREAKAA